MVRKLVALVVLVVGVVAVATPAGAATTRTISGTVACQRGKPVVGVKVESSEGGSALAQVKRRPLSLWLADYSATVTTSTATTRVRLIVGCGRAEGSTTAWWSRNSTPEVSVRGDKDISALCAEERGSGQRCDLWGQTVLVGMPFSGKWACSSTSGCGGQHPSVHAGAEGEWKMDVYANGVAVRPFVFAKKSDRLVMKVGKYEKTCGTAGHDVQVDVFVNGSRIGWVGYGHLADVPGRLHDQGAVIELGEELGSTYQWDGGQAKCWLVSSTSGVHTHMSFYGMAGRSCYADYTLGTKLASRRLIGRLGTGGPATGYRCPRLSRS